MKTTVIKTAVGAGVVLLALSGCQPNSGPTRPVCPSTANAWAPNRPVIDEGCR